MMNDTSSKSSSVDTSGEYCEHREDSAQRPSTRTWSSMARTASSAVKDWLQNVKPMAVATIRNLISLADERDCDPSESDHGTGMTRTLKIVPNICIMFQSCL